MGVRARRNEKLCIIIHWDNLHSKNETSCGLWLVATPLFLSSLSYICIVLRQARRSGLRTAWGCVLHCVYLIAWPPTVTARFKSGTKCFLSCFPLPGLPADLPRVPWRRGKTDRLPAVSRGRSQPLSICQSGGDCHIEFLEHRAPC